MSNLFISRWKIDPAKREEFMGVFNALYAGAKDLLERESTAYHYGWGRNENEFIAIEAWKDEAVVAGLRQSPEFKELFRQMMACSSAPMEMEMINDLANDRAVFNAQPPGKSLVHPDVGHGTVFI